MSFGHRNSIEGGDWDGAGLQISIDGGEFKNVPRSAFIQSGYTNLNPLIGNHVLRGLDGFSVDSPGYLDGTFITSIANVDGVAAGSSIQVRFVGAFDEGARGTNIPNWEIDSIKVDTLPDTDGDGISDVFEDANSLDKNVDDSADDADSDNSTILEEFVAGTDPNDDDSNNDGLKDGVESNSGTYVDATDTGIDPLNPDTDSDGLLDLVEDPGLPFNDSSQPGTDPLNPDTDDDGLLDGVEDNGGIFVSPSQTGTNPNPADTDEDFQEDGFEVEKIHRPQRSQQQIRCSDNHHYRRFAWRRSYRPRKRWRSRCNCSRNSTNSWDQL